MPDSEPSLQMAPTRHSMERGIVRKALQGYLLERGVKGYRDNNGVLLCKSCFRQHVLQGTLQSNNAFASGQGTVYCLEGCLANGIQTFSVDINLLKRRHSIH